MQTKFGVRFQRAKLLHVAVARRFDRANKGSLEGWALLFENLHGCHDCVLLDLLQFFPQAKNSSVYSTSHRVMTKS